MAWNVYDWAKFYVFEKRFSVIPIPHKKKSPVISWKEFQERLPTEDELKKWFGGKTLNIGIVTGELSNLTVVDLDGPIAIEFAKRHNFLPTPIVQSGKGFHAYYSYYPGSRNWQQMENLSQLDLRSQGGQVVAPPSIHPSGRQYEWGRYNLENTEINELPDIIKKFCDESAANRGAQNPPLKKIYKGVDKGARTNSLVRIVCSMARDGCTVEDCVEFGYFWNRKNNPPLPEAKLLFTINDVHRRYARGRPRPLNPKVPVDVDEILKKIKEL